MGSQLLQNTEIIKQTNVLLWKIWRIYGSVSYLFSCTVSSLYLHCSMLRVCLDSLDQHLTVLYEQDLPCCFLIKTCKVFAIYLCGIQSFNQKSLLITPNLTSESKKPGQIAVVIHYCNLSRFFWLRRYFISLSSECRVVGTYRVVGTVPHQFVFNF